MSSEPLVKYLADGTAEVTISRDRAMKLSVEVWANRKLGLETPSWMIDVAALVDPTIRTEPTARNRRIEWVIAPAVPEPIRARVPALEAGWGVPSSYVGGVSEAAESRVPAPQTAPDVSYPGHD